VPGSYYFDMVVIGGGTTGTAVARDLAMRGFTNILLVEKNDLGAGTSGRCHSNLHGGGRYIVNDIETAKECVQENRILRKIAPHTIDPTNGLFIAVDDEGLEYTEEFIKNADAIGMYYRELDPEQVMREEPLLTRNILRALETHDAGFDPFRLSVSQAIDAARRGATIWVHHEILKIEVSGGKVVAVLVRDNLTGETKRVATEFIVNAAGPWSGKVCATAGIDIPMKPDKGTCAVYNFRLARPMVHILRMPTDGDAFVSMGYQSTTILGTTSGEIVDPDRARPTLEEVERMEAKARPAFPGIKQAKRLRFFSGVRPLCQAGPATGREISRRLILIDHQEVHGVDGLITITGGKFATARLMAEVAVDRVCSQLGLERPCTTHLELLPGAETGEEVDRDGRKIARTYSLPFYATQKLVARYGHESAEMLTKYAGYAYPICQCGQVLAAEVVRALDEEWAETISDIRRRTRSGMGTCQGINCLPRIAALYRERKQKSPQELREEMANFLQERWNGMHLQDIQGDMVSQVMMLQTIYGTVANLPGISRCVAGEGGGE